MSETVKTERRGREVLNPSLNTRVDLAPTGQQLRRPDHPQPLRRPAPTHRDVGHRRCAEEVVAQVELDAVKGETLRLVDSGGPGEA